MAGTADWASLDALEWENGFNALLANISKNGTELGIYYSAARSFGDLTAESMFQDMDILVVGVAIMIFYVQFVISKFNCVEARVRSFHVTSVIVYAFPDCFGVYGFIISWNGLHCGLWFMLTCRDLIWPCSYLFAVSFNGLGGGRYVCDNSLLGGVGI
uniref:Uncharacterized protein n=1 Tax=Photinus pyralis TaxID=7054 RepID=A0A1Y1L628_PHOPY